MLIMVKFLVIQLDDTSSSYCHYSNPKAVRRLIPLDTLRKAIFYGLKENVIFQFVYPDYKLPAEYYDIINSVYHADIISYDNISSNDFVDDYIIVIDDLTSIENPTEFEGKAVAIRASLNQLFFNKEVVANLLPFVERLTIILTDVEVYSDDSNVEYTEFLEYLSDRTAKEFSKCHYAQVNLLTDRLFLKEMNNCNAGYESVTLCPDGKYYPCPAFYLHNPESAMGDVNSGIIVKNPQLYQINKAPICRLCDCWHCKRCVWLNFKLTREINTPSHQQCVLSHIERNASRNLLAKIRKIDDFLPEVNIEKLDYLDPFDLLY